ncbi:DNA repair protein RadC [Lachnospiraceae bacterium]|nr:DNA repair protein RadC [Lachnospiraceae bacterium]
MCSITTYRVEKDELSHPFLVAEDSVEYGKSVVKDPEDAVDLVNDVFRMKHLAEEIVCMIALDNKGGVLGLFKVSHGTIDRSVCNPREIYIRALVSGASSIIILHNHTSGNPSPSDQDIIICDRLSQVSNLIGVRLNDFIIIGDDYYSFKEKNEMSLL